MGKLTFQQINHAKPREKQYKMADGRGLYLLVKPNASKLWQGKYRFGGKEKTHSMGIFPEIWSSPGFVDGYGLIDSSPSAAVLS